MRRIAPAALLLALGMGACSYSPSPAQFPTHLKTLAVPILKNETTEPNIEQEVTQAIVDVFVQDNKLRVVDEAQADLVISGSVVRYTNSVFGFNAREQAEEYQVAVAVRLTGARPGEEPRDVARRQPGAHHELLRRRARGQTPQDQYTSRKDAIAKIADAVLNKTVEGW